MLKKLGAPPGEGIRPIFKLPEHENLRDEEITNDLAHFFSKSSQEYAPLDPKLLPQ